MYTYLCICLQMIGDLTPEILDSMDMNEKTEVYAWWKQTIEPSEVWKILKLRLSTAH